MAIPVSPSRPVAKSHAAAGSGTGVMVAARVQPNSSDWVVMLSVFVPATEVPVSAGVRLPFNVRFLSSGPPMVLPLYKFQFPERP